MAISAIVGGTASRLGGGKFANGAVSAAFVHMYNAMGHPTYPSKKNFIEGFSEDVSRAYRALSMMVRSQGMGIRGLQPLTYSQAYDRVLIAEAHNDTMTLALFSLAGGFAGGAVLRAGYTYAMANPGIVTGGTVLVDRINNLINPSLPPTTPEGQIWFMWDHRDGNPH